MPLLYTVYITSGSGDLWFEVFFHPFFSSISTPFAKVESRSIAEPIFWANPADLKAGAQFASCLIHWSAVNQQCSSTHDVLGGVMQAPSAVESDMSCWPVYIYVVCLNHCILKCGSIQQRKGMQRIAARLIKTALNIKLKNKTLKDIELAP